MANYRASIVEGQVIRWVRANKIIIENPEDGFPSIKFVEEEITKLPDNTKLPQPLGGSLMDTMEDPSKIITLINPGTDEVIGSTTYMELYVILYSFYRQLATVRDNPPTEPPV